jgi:hypothetical protein
VQFCCSNTFQTFKNSPESSVLDSVSTCDVQPIAAFRADNRAAFKSVFRQFTLLCKRKRCFDPAFLF